MAGEQRARVAVGGVDPPDGKARAIRFSTLDAIWPGALVPARPHSAVSGGANKTRATGRGWQKKRKPMNAPSNADPIFK